MFSRFDTIPECDRHPATQQPSHVAVAITLNALAKASSLKISARRYVALTASVKVRIGSPKTARNKQVCAQQKSYTGSKFSKKKFEQLYNVYTMDCSCAPILRLFFVASDGATTERRI